MSYYQDTGLVYDGQVATSTTPAALPSQACSGVNIQNDPASTTNILVGNATTQHTVLTPGSSVYVKCPNMNTVWLKSASLTPNANLLGNI